VATTILRNMLLTRHVTGYLCTRVTRVPRALDDVVSIICQALPPGMVKTLRRSVMESPLRYSIMQSESQRFKVDRCTLTL